MSSSKDIIVTFVSYALFTEGEVHGVISRGENKKLRQHGGQVKTNSSRKGIKSAKFNFETRGGNQKGNGGQFTLETPLFLPLVIKLGCERCAKIPSISKNHATNTYKESMLLLCPLLNDQFQTTRCI